jgi:hypothetical protein
VSAGQKCPFSDGIDIGDVRSRAGGERQERTVKIKTVMAGSLLVATGMLVGLLVGDAGDESSPAAHASAAVPSAQSAISAAPRLGTNVEGLADWAVEMPFTDLFKSSRPWISGAVGVWDDGRTVDVDDNGWVRSLAPGQVARTAVLTDHTDFRPGIYDFTYVGTGRFDFGRPATEVAPGHFQIDLSDGAPTFIFNIVETDPADPIRNIVITQPGGVCADTLTKYAPDESACAPGQYLPFVGNTEQILFNPDFLAVTVPYESVRFMNWLATNNSTLAAWADRPQMTDARWTINGVPIEMMVALANQLDVHPWFTLSHLGDDDYVRNFAILVRDQLEPGLIAYVEYSNEVWNSGFQQHHWAAERGAELGLADTPWGNAWLYYAKRATEVHKLWVEVFGGRERLHLVTASHVASGFVAEQILGFGDTAAWTDSLSIAPYFGDVPNTEEAAAPLRTMTTQQYLDHIEADVLPEVIADIDENKAVADRFGVALTAYEGGQHFVAGWALIDDPAINKLFDDVNRDPRMGQIYTRYLDAWEAAGGGLFEHFVNVSKWLKWGRWGALESLYQGTSPKFDALMAYGAKGSPQLCPTP